LADTNPGSSGSPVFNDQWEVIALHHWGGPTEVVTPDGKPVRKDVNEGVRISMIRSSLVSKRNKIGGSQRILIDAALNPQSRQPSTVDDNVIKRVSEQATSNRSQSPDTISQEVRADGTVAWKIPLEVSVRLVGLRPPQVTQPIAHKEQAVSEEDKIITKPSLEEAIHIDPNYSNRSGYDPNFLPRRSIPLPRLSDSQKRKAAKLKRAKRGENPYELKYQHFSIVMNADRRMAFFTAANIDGSKWIEVDRDTGEPEKAEAREKWYQDLRIDPSAQCDQSLFDDQVPERVFDRGHLARRQDPNWGSPNKARRANADTFHFTNCSTQERYFNQNKKHWQGIENYILDNAKAEQKRVAVFTGPVQANDDPAYRNVRVPMQFWKILVRVQNGRLLTTALLADQSNRIRLLPERRYRREAFDDMSEIIEYQASVHEIERITGLDFGSLRKYDTFQAGPEGANENKARIKSFADIRLDS
jgi:endonuclease G